MSRGRIAFYSEFAWPLLARSPIEFAGGAESMVVRLARSLVARGWEVTLITCDYGQRPVETVDGITVLRAFRPGRGIPGLRFLHPRLSLATAALLRAKADLYYVVGSGMAAGLTGDVARFRGVPCVLHMMTDWDVIPDPPAGVGVTHRPWYLRALRRADRVLAQTRFQQEQLERNFGVASVVLPNIMEIPPQAVDAGQDGVVLWNATYKATKRPEWFVQLARELPVHRFVMCGIVPPPPVSAAPWDAALAAAREIPHLEVRGFLPETELAALRRRAALVVHTSPVEGFSNVLLESWAAGLPTVAGVNPDGLIEREGLGGYAPTYAALRGHVERLMADPAARREAGARARRYAAAVHAPEVVLAQLEDELDRLLERGRARPRPGRAAAAAR